MQFSGVKKTAGVHGKSGRTKKVYFLQRIYLQCTLKITMKYEGKDVEYEANDIGDWVDNGKNNHLRIASRTSGMYIIYSIKPFLSHS